MDMVIKIIGIVLALLALGCLIKPDLLRGSMRFFGRGSRVYAIAMMRFALAVVFLVAARECRNEWVILAFGILFFVALLFLTF